MYSLAYIAFIITLVYIIFYTRKRMVLSWVRTVDSLKQNEHDQINAIQKEESLKEENRKKEEAVANIVNLYEMTKKICEFMDEDKILSSFKEWLRRFVDFKECKYIDVIDSKEDLALFEVIPLVSKKKQYGYLAFKGLVSEERPILDILLAQLVSGIKRVRFYSLVQELAITDDLTRVFTRRHFFTRFNEELRRLAELDLSLAFLMIDIDNFKSFNDSYGHIVGDVILKAIADVIKSNCREIDLIGRFGGEEFMVALPITSKEGALFAAERIRQSVESRKIRAFDEYLSVTISLGVAIFPQDAKDAQELIDKADWALYRSKRMGKNKVSVYARYE